ncbi:MAG: LysM peptidoglycan-binding domain-containing protein [Chloroflexi bacterium]|nr:LysM peptidoglycan-binding domain-containing protein [Chloroflexota bacterium]
MKYSMRVLILLVVFGTIAALARPAAAASPNFVVVSYGDTLYKIAARTGTSVDALIRANGIPNANFIYAGQRIMIPPSSSAPSVPAPVQSTSNVYTVVPGDSLAIIAGRFGTTVAELMRTNGLYNPNFIYSGQRLNVPGRTPPTTIQPPTAPVANPPTRPNPAPAPSTTGKWIDINISKQTITAYQGSTPLKSVLVSTGVAWTPTPIGHYAIKTKIQSQAMSGPGYYLPGVPWVMYFTGAYAIHGTYWHHNFGTPMSHGCVNLTIDDAKWFYDFADIGTPVISHL